MARLIVRGIDTVSWPARTGPSCQYGTAGFSFVRELGGNERLILDCRRYAEAKAVMRLILLVMLIVIASGIALNV